jgi:hypothetical protein
MGAHSVIVLVKAIAKLNLGAECDLGVMRSHHDADRTTD